MQNRGKQFEQKIREDFQNLPDSFLLRLPDQVSGHKATSANVCDFVGYIKPLLFLLEAKSINGNTFPLVNFTQLDRMSAYNLNGLRKGVIIWFVSHDKVIYVPVKTMIQMIKDGKKSINIKTLDSEEYDYIEIPSVKKRVYLDSDYSKLKDLPEGW